MQPQEIGARFARALAAKDAEALLGLVAPDVDVRALTPGRPWEASSAEELVHDVLLGHWYEDTDVITGVDSVDTGAVGDRHRVTWRFRVELCSGFRPAGV